MSAANIRQKAVKFLDIFGANFQYFKNGYGGYLTYVVVMFSTVSSVYYLMIVNTPWLHAIFPNVTWLFVIGLPAVLIAGTALGWFEQNSSLRRAQMRIDPFQRVQFELFRRLAEKNAWPDLVNDIDFLMQTKK